MKINCLIIDNDQENINFIKSFLDNFEEYSIVGETNSGIEALNIIENIGVDLIILDDKLNDISGIGLLQSLYNPPKAIVISSNPSLALQCFELNVIDFVLKPYDTNRLLKAFNKYRFESKSIKDISLIKYKKKINEILKLKVNSKIFYLRLKDILYIESIREFIKVHYCNSEELVIKYVLATIEELLPKESFVRIHKSYIISIDKLSSVSNKYVEISNKKIPIGSIYKKQAIKVITDF